MKLTKQRLKEIIKEEVDRSSIRESDGDDWGYMPPRKRAAVRQHQLGDLQTEPRFDTGRSPEQKLIDALAQRAAVDGMSAEDAAAAYGLEGDAEVIAYIQGLLGDKMLDNPRGVEETLKDDLVKISVQLDELKGKASELRARMTSVEDLIEEVESAKKVLKMLNPKNIGCVIALVMGGSVGGNSWLNRGV